MPAAREGAATRHSRHGGTPAPGARAPGRASPAEQPSILTLSSLVAGVGDHERGVSWLSSAGSSVPRGELGSGDSAAWMDGRAGRQAGVGRPACVGE